VFALIERPLKPFADPPRTYLYRSTFTGLRQPKEFIMKMFKIIALTATLLAGASVANASPFDSNGGFESMLAIDSADSAVVLTVNDAEARSLSFDNDVKSVQQRIKNNRALLSAITSQGYTLEQIVGVDGGENDLTLYAL
jgi:acyl-CoA synthetase (AMP-forming)/AMP-acid ligase II